MMRGLRIGAAVVCGVLALAPAARAADQEAVQRAIDKGVAYLKQANSEAWNYRSGNFRAPNPVSGVTALVGLTLLECGVPADDPVVQKAATHIRGRSIDFTDTYSLSLGIMFLDLLGDARDAELIKSMAVRLMAGQNSAGAWTYGCPPISQEEADRLKKLVEQPPERKTGDPAKGGPRPEDLSKDMRDQLERIGKRQGPPQPGDLAPLPGETGNQWDNSNTQFAVLALWIARRQGIPVDDALRRVDAHFRETQEPDGSWRYDPQTAVVRPAMTCAGLLGLGVGFGSASEAVLRTEGKDKEPGRDTKAKPPGDPDKDPRIKAGFDVLHAYLTGDLTPQRQPGPGGPGPFVTKQPTLSGLDGRNYYFLWSVERVAVAYGLETIRGKNWYDWGVKILLPEQQKDGNWDNGSYPGPHPLVDTCFALLFLRRANLAKDLTAILKGRIRDPGQRELHAVGSEDQEKRLHLKPGGDDKPEPPGGDSRDKPKPSGTEKANTEAGRLSAELVNAPEPKREEVLKKLRDSKGGEYTDALADAIPKLTGDVKTKARDALAERLARMTAGTLKDKLRDDELEVRRAAALAVAMKEEKSLVPRLIELLEDPEPPVARAAHAALKNLSSQDFGPGPEASRAERAQAVSAWKDWWAKQGDK